jgi:predicted DNA-binding protein with PD1-like motif
MEISWAKTRDERCMMIRLSPGTDLIEGLERALKEGGVIAGAVVSCIGSLRRAAFHIAVPADNPIGASYSPPIGVEGPLELISAQGTIGLEEDGSPFVHLHAVFSDGKGVLRGGHIVKGECPVLVTCEIAVKGLEGIRIVRRFDPGAEMKVFMVEKGEH